MAKSISHDRKITIYPANQLKDLVVAECAIANLSRSEIVSRALEVWYRSMEAGQLKAITDKAEKMAMYPKKQA